MKNLKSKMFLIYFAALTTIFLFTPSFGMQNLSFLEKIKHCFSTICDPDDDICQPNYYKHKLYDAIRLGEYFNYKQIFILRSISH